MQKIKKVFVLLTALATAVIFIAGDVLAAEVIKVHTSKGHITIDEGKQAGFIMGAEVCIFSSSGEKIACGQVRKTSENSAMIKVNNRLAKKIENGMTARLMTAKTDEQTD